MKKKQKNKKTKKKAKLADLGCPQSILVDIQTRQPYSNKKYKDITTMLSPGPTSISNALYRASIDPVFIIKSLIIIVYHVFYCTHLCVCVWLSICVCVCFFFAVIALCPNPSLPIIFQYADNGISLFFFFLSETYHSQSRSPCSLV